MNYVDVDVLEYNHETKLTRNITLNLLTFLILLIKLIIRVKESEYLTSKQHVQFPHKATICKFGVVSTTHNHI